MQGPPRAERERVGGADDRSAAPDDLDQRGGRERRELELLLGLGCPLGVTDVECDDGSPPSLPAVVTDSPSTTPRTSPR